VQICPGVVHAEVGRDVHPLIEVCLSNGRSGSRIGRTATMMGLAIALTKLSCSIAQLAWHTFRDESGIHFCVWRAFMSSISSARSVIPEVQFVEASLRL
jgi:hypothetical protein